MVLRARPISFNELLKNQRYFCSFISKVHSSGGLPYAKRQVITAPPSFTYSERYPRHDKFLNEHREKIRIFADVGCGIVKGAPTTIDAKKALGNESKVYAVDFTDNPKMSDLSTTPPAAILKKWLKTEDRGTRERLKRIIRVEASDLRKARKAIKEGGIIPKKHLISQAPLPFQCDAIRFANVSMHMSHSERRNALLNIWNSLKPGGFLLGSTVVPEGESEFILRKTARGFEEITDF